jgi:Immunoglobulin-like domain of bacterial spore germination/Sporulation and spore germination
MAEPQPTAKSQVPWPLFILGLVLVVTSGVAIFFLNDDDPDGATDPGASPSPTPTSQVSESAPPDESESPAPNAAVSVYFVGDTPRGLGLYAELHPASSEDLLVSAVDLAVSQTPLDPDYRQPWPDGIRANASYDGDIITVDLATNGTDLHDLPAQMSPDEAKFALEQVIFTAQDAAGAGRAGVQFLLDGGRSDQVLGQPTSEPLANGPVLETLSLINITTPGEGASASGSLEVVGLSNSFEANVILSLEGAGTSIGQSAQADGWMEEKLFPFATSFDLADVEPGTYVLTATTDDPSGGEEGFGPFEDTKTITIE